MAAGKVLLHSLAVRNPDTFEASVLLAGTKKSDVPDWADVHEDNFGSADEVESTPATPQTPETPASGVEDEGPDYASMTPDDLKALAAERELEVEGTGSNGNVLKGDLVAALTDDDEAKAAEQS